MPTLDHCRLARPRELPADHRDFLDWLQLRAGLDDLLDAIVAHRVVTTVSVDHHGLASTIRVYDLDREDLLEVKRRAIERLLRLGLTTYPRAGFLWTARPDRLVASLP